MKKLGVFSAIITGVCMAFSTIMPISGKFANAAEEVLTSKSKAAYLCDYHSGTTIYSSNADDRLPIASMTKLATLSVIFNNLQQGKLNLQDKITISQNAADTEGSSAFLDAGSTYSVADLIKTIVVVSANDSCVALAEHIAGNEQAFADSMNKLCESLGLTNTHFANSTGLPADNHYSSARDMAEIYRTVCDNDTYKSYAKIWMEDFIHPSGRKTGLVNTNRLIKTYQGCDSGKTGHTNEALYCLTASASRGGMRLISVVIGAPDSKIRFAEATNMFNYGFANYTNKEVVSTQAPIAQVSVKGGQIKSIDCFAAKPYIAFLAKTDDSQFNTRVQLNSNVKAPVAVGDKVGTLLVLNQNNIVIEEIDLIAGDSVQKIKLGQILDNIYQNW